MPSSTPSWTNHSVKALGEIGDPVRTIQTIAREATFAAIEAGWTGPPFDPIKLAELRGIKVEPRGDIKDARTSVTTDGTYLIEFNPNRPRGRLRYSIAHEIAHTLFPDCKDKIRNRADKSEMTGDDWQLEMLCNIAAAELVMPIGSFPTLSQSEVSIAKLMDLRREFDVSIEALLLRFIRLTTHPCALIAASRYESGPLVGRYKVDYAVASLGWNRAIPIGMVLADGSVVGDCTAIGHTAVSDEVWGTDKLCLHLECVGTSPFPGQVYPRVLGLATVADDREVPRGKLLSYVGDATKPQGTPPIIIAHIMNDKSATWAAGFAKALQRTYSQAQIEYRHWFSQPGNQALGMTHFFGETRGITIATMIAQSGFGPSSSPRIRYPALQDCLRSVATQAKQLGATVHMPRIGCGQAGGSWAVIGEIINQSLINSGVTVTIYDLK